MANRNKGWSKLNHRKQMEANKSRGQIEKWVLEDGTFFKFNLLPAKRLRKGWNVRNEKKQQRIAIAQIAQKERMSRRGKRAAMFNRYPRKNGKTGMVKA